MGDLIWRTSWNLIAVIDWVTVSCWRILLNPAALVRVFLTVTCWKRHGVATAQNVLFNNRMWNKSLLQESLSKMSWRSSKGKVSIVLQSWRRRDQIGDCKLSWGRRNQNKTRFSLQRFDFQPPCKLSCRRDRGSKTVCWVTPLLGNRWVKEKRYESQEKCRRLHWHEVADGEVPATGGDPGITTSLHNREQVLEVWSSMQHIQLISRVVGKFYDSILSLTIWSVRSKSGVETLN